MPEEDRIIALHKELTKGMSSLARVLSEETNEWLDVIAEVNEEQKTHLSDIKKEIIRERTLHEKVLNSLEKFVDNKLSVATPTIPQNNFDSNNLAPAAQLNPKDLKDATFMASEIIRGNDNVEDKFARLEKTIKESSRPGLFAGIGKSFEKAGEGFNKSIQSLTKPISDVLKLPGQLFKNVAEIPKKMFGGIKSFFGGIFGGGKGFDAKQFEELTKHLESLKKATTLSNALLGKNLDYILDLKHFLYENINPGDAESLEERYERIKREKNQHDEMMKALFGIKEGASFETESEQSMFGRVLGFLGKGKGKIALKGISAKLIPALLVKGGALFAGLLKFLPLLLSAPVLIAAVGALAIAAVARSGAGEWIGDKIYEGWRRVRGKKSEEEQQEEDRRIASKSKSVREAARRAEESASALIQEDLDFDAAREEVKREFARIKKVAGDISPERLDAAKSRERRILSNIAKAEREFLADPQKFLEEGFESRNIQIQRVEDIGNVELTDEMLRASLEFRRTAQWFGGRLRGRAEKTAEITAEDIERERQRINDLQPQATTQQENLEKLKIDDSQTTSQTPIQAPGTESTQQNNVFAPSSQNNSRQTTIVNNNPHLDDVSRNLVMESSMGW